MNSDTAQTPFLIVDDVTKTFGRFTALDSVSFSAQKGEFISVLGPSGCGKTTILRVIAGLEEQDSGRVLFGTTEVSSLPVSKRQVGIVFQSYALFPNLTAGDNVAYGLRSHMREKSRVTRRVDELMQLVGLTGMVNKYPAQLSGGQQQRVALARAMALSPNLLLLDEPLSALDAKVRVHLRSEIRQLQERLGVTTIMVTHDQEEALTMADRILVMNEGRIVQMGSPLDIYDRPATPFVASFIGSMNFIYDAVRTGDLFTRGDLTIASEQNHNVAEGGKATVAIRPEDVAFLSNGEAGRNVFRARVRSMEYRGPVFRVDLELPQKAGLLEAEAATEKVGRLNLSPDRMVSIRLPEDRIRVYPTSGGDNG